MYRAEYKHYGQTVVKIHVGDESCEARQIILPMPPSENERIAINYAGLREQMEDYGYGRARSKRGVFRNTKEYNSWLAFASKQLRKGLLPILENDVAVFMTVVFPDYRRRDAQNREKAFFDALTQSEHVYRDDSQVMLHTNRCVVKKGFSFITAYVAELKDMPMQLAYDINNELLDKIAEMVHESDNTQGMAKE